MSTTKVTDSMRDVTVVDGTKVSGAVPTAALSNVDLVEGTKGADIASAGTMVIGTDSGYFDITGTTGITAMTVAAGRRFAVQFDGVLTMTHHATNLDLPGEASITTAAGDVAEFFATGTNTVQCVNYTKADGTAVVAGAGGDTRNFIIDGAFTQSPEGDKTANADATYTAAALLKLAENGGEVVVDTKITADGPTVAESGFDSQTCFHLDVTTAESAVGAAEYLAVIYAITGTDYQYLDNQEVTISFWHKHTKTGIFCVGLLNQNNSKSYAFEYTQTTTNTWERHTETVTLNHDSEGTFTYNESGFAGLYIYFIVFAGTDRHISADTWSSGTDWATSNQVNGADSTSNNFKLAQFGLYLGSSAPTFLGEPISTVQDQVDYYVHYFDFENGGGATDDKMLATGMSFSTTVTDFLWNYTDMRKAPTITSTAAGTFDVHNAAVGKNVSAISFNNITKNLCRIRTVHASGTNGAPGWLAEDIGDVTNILRDARH